MANHDLLSAIITGYGVAGYDGAQAAIAHLLEDMLSDSLLKVNARDIFESLLRQWSKYGCV